MLGALGSYSQAQQKASPNRGVHDYTMWFWRYALRSVIMPRPKHRNDARNSHKPRVPWRRQDMSAWRSESRQLVQGLSSLKKHDNSENFTFWN